MPIGAILGAAAIGGVATVGSSLIASNAASNAASQNNALEQQIYEQNSANEKPYIQSGDTADNLWQANNSESDDARPKLARRWHLQSQSSASSRSIFRRTTWQTCQVQPGAREASSQQQWTRLSRGPRSGEERGGADGRAGKGN